MQGKQVGQFLDGLVAAVGEGDVHAGKVVVCQALKLGGQQPQGGRQHAFAQRASDQQAGQYRAQRVRAGVHGSRACQQRGDVGGAVGVRKHGVNAAKTRRAACTAWW
jgi:hypothetical protein